MGGAGCGAGLVFVGSVEEYVVIVLRLLHMLLGKHLRHLRACPRHLVVMGSFHASAVQLGLQAQLVDLLLLAYTHAGAPTLAVY